jgi:hypothetical protein
VIGEAEVQDAAAEGVEETAETRVEPKSGSGYELYTLGQWEASVFPSPIPRVGDRIRVFHDGPESAALEVVRVTWLVEVDGKGSGTVRDAPHVDTVPA